MIPEQVKQAHDRIWAVREKINLRYISVFDHTGDCHHIKIHCGQPGILNINSLDTNYFSTTEQVNQFLKELE